MFCSIEFGSWYDLTFLGFRRKQPKLPPLPTLHPAFQPDSRYLLSFLLLSSFFFPSLLFHSLPVLPIFSLFFSFLISPSPLFSSIIFFSHFFCCLIRYSFLLLPPYISFPQGREGTTTTRRRDLPSVSSWENPRNGTI